jgi:hypothetical protein
MVQIDNQNVGIGFRQLRQRRIGIPQFPKLR